MHFLTTLGIVLALIGTGLIWVLKTPKQTSDRVLITILLTFVIKFMLDEIFLLTGNLLFSSIGAIFGISSILSCGWYIKFLTLENKRFGKKELLSYLPLVILLSFVLLILAWASVNPYCIGFTFLHSC